ncbi:hypothetical protein SNEBB_009026 [Seison nebaliae]|nr:hypothetical protein SNEBB_009026 [Seison nebaliae]
MDKSLWVERYRPADINDIISQKHVVDTLQSCLSGTDEGDIILPNLLFYGPPGTGKTSTILAVAHQLFGKKFKERVLELNASDERGIDVVRERIKFFARTAVSCEKKKANFKLIILEEADSMTYAAQAALRRTMEHEIDTTRFCITCNYITKIIPPILSRCVVFRFHPLTIDDGINRLATILEKESIHIDNYRQILERLMKLSNGDMRQATHYLQNISNFFQKNNFINISVDDIDECVGIIPMNYIDHFLQFINSSSQLNSDRFVDEFLREAFSFNRLIEQIHDVIIHPNLIRSFSEETYERILNLTDGQLAELTTLLAELNVQNQNSESEYLYLHKLIECFKAI